MGLRRDIFAPNGDLNVPQTIGNSSQDSQPGPSAFKLPSSAKVTDYLVGLQLDEAIAASQDILVSWPFADGNIADWTQAEAIWWVLFFWIEDIGFRTSMTSLGPFTNEQRD